jgi:glutamine amidotransferase
VCRHLAYIGAATPLRRLLFDAEHSLARQAARPRFQLAGNDNPHGWGVAWYSEADTPAIDSAPMVHHSTAPIWEDDVPPSIEHADVVACVAAARLASPGTVEIDARNNAPFVSGEWSFSMNGWAFVDDPRRERALRDALTPARAATLAGDTDSEVLFGLILEHLDAGESPAEAVAKVNALVEPGPGVRVNMLLTDGRRVIATANGNSLFTALTDTGIRIASEPTEDATSWKRVADLSIIEADRECMTIESL